MLARLLSAVLAALLVCAPPLASAQVAIRATTTSPQVSAPLPTTYTGLGAAFQEDIAIAGGGAIGAALNVTNTKSITMGCWFYTPHFTNSGNNHSRGYPVPMCLRSNGNGACENTSVAAAFCMALDSASSVSYVQLNFPDNVASGGAHTYQMVGNGTGKTTWTSGCWNFVLLTFTLGATGHAAIMRGACGGTPVDVGNLHGTGDYVTNNYQNITPDLNNSAGVTGGQPGMGWANTNQTDIAYGWQGPTFVAEEAMVCTAAATPYADCVSADTIAPSVLALFGHRDVTTGYWVPNDPGTDCHVYSPTARVPEVCLYGDGDGMIPNHGTADSGTGSPTTAFTKIQIDTGAQLWKPPYGPSGIIAHRATMKWYQHGHASATGTSFTTASSGTGQSPLPLAVGDLIVIGGAITDTSTTVNHAMTCPTGGANTWTAVGPVQEQTQHHMNAIVCWTIAQAGDLSGAYAVTWTTANTRDMTYFIADYGNAASVDFGAMAATTASQATGPTPSGHTTANANETIISGLFSFSTNKTYNPPGVSGCALPASNIAGMTRFRYPQTGTAIQNIIMDANATTEGSAIASGTNTQTAWCLTSNDSSIGWTLAVNPS